MKSKVTLPQIDPDFPDPGIPENGNLQPAPSDTSWLEVEQLRRGRKSKGRHRQYETPEKLGCDELKRNFREDLTLSMWHEARANFWKALKTYLAEFHVKVIDDLPPATRDYLLERWETEKLGRKPI